MKLSLIGSILPFVLHTGEGRSYLRRNQQQNSVCYNTPVLDSNSSIFVVLELNGTGWDDGTDGTAVNTTFVNAYDLDVSCDQEDAIRFVQNATIDTDAIDLDASLRWFRGSFTKLVQVDMKCNSCGNSGGWQLFNTTYQVAATSSLSSSSSSSCTCAGPDEGSFTAAFRRLFDINQLQSNSLSDISIMRVTQVPVLSSTSCQSSSTTTYSRSGVCLSKSQRTVRLSQSPSQSPSASSTTGFPTTIEPTYTPTTMEPTGTPLTFEPTSMAPTDSPTKEPTAKPTCGDLLGCGTVDEHGCVGDGGYTWCPELEQCVQDWVNPCPGPPTPAPILLPPPELTDPPTIVVELTEPPTLMPVTPPTPAPILIPPPEPTEQPIAPRTEPPVEETNDPTTMPVAPPTPAPILIPPPEPTEMPEEPPMDIPVEPRTGGDDDDDDDDDEPTKPPPTDAPTTGASKGRRSIRKLKYNNAPKQPEDMIII